MDYLNTNLSMNCTIDGFIVCDYSGVAEFPGFEFTLYNITINLTNTTFVNCKGGNNRCILEIQFMNVDNYLWVLGDPIFKQYYIHFDVDN